MAETCRKIDQDDSLAQVYIQQESELFPRIYFVALLPSDRNHSVGVKVSGTSGRVDISRLSRSDLILLSDAIKFTLESERAPK